MSNANWVWKNPQNSIHGGNPTWHVGTSAVDGDAVPWVQMRVGSKYTYIDTTNDVAVTYEKIKNDGADNDFSPVGGMLVIKETFSYSDMTDGGSTVGTYALTQTIPVGAVVLRSALQNVTGFAGDTSAALTLGDGSDVDRYNTSTLNVFADVTAVDGGAVSGTAVHATAATVTVTITTASDFTSVSAGQATVKIFCLL